MSQRLTAFLCVAFLLLSSSLLHAQSNLETPAPGSFVSGLGFVAGWKCTGGELTFSIDDGPQAPLAYKISREDTQGVCGDSTNGFIAQENWNLVGNGQHTIRIFDNGQQFTQATFTVTTLGTEFLTGASGTYILPSFPTAGRTVIVQWQESQQNFVVVGASGTEGCDPSYPTVCIPPPPPDLNCRDIPYRNFTVLPPDPHRFDADRDGIGCEQ